MQDKTSEGSEFQLIQAAINAEKHSLAVSLVIELKVKLSVIVYYKKKLHFLFCVIRKCIGNLVYQVH